MYRTILVFFYFFQDFTLNIQKLCPCYTSHVFMPFMRFKSIIYITLELQLFASLADYTGDAWEIIIFFPCHVSGKARSAKIL